MHETSVTLKIVQTVLDAAEKHGAKKVVETHVVIGKLSLVGIEQVRFVYDILVKGTIMEGSKLRIEEKDGLIRCSTCGYERAFSFGDSSPSHSPTVPIVNLQCPKCEGTMKIVEGRECCIKNVMLF